MIDVFYLKRTNLHKTPIGYFVPGNLGGFYGGQAQYAFGENASNATTDAGDYFGVRVG